MDSVIYVRSVNVSPAIRSGVREHILHTYRRIYTHPPTQRHRHIHSKHWISMNGSAEIEIESEWNVKWVHKRRTEKVTAEMCTKALRHSNGCSTIIIMTHLCSKSLKLQAYISHRKKYMIRYTQWRGTAEKKIRFECVVNCTRKSPFPTTTRAITTFSYYCASNYVWKSSALKYFAELLCKSNNYGIYERTFIWMFVFVLVAVVVIVQNSIAIRSSICSWIW